MWLSPRKTRRNAPTGPRRNLQPAPRSRLRLEALEDRTVPAVGFLDPTFGTGGTVLINFPGSTNDTGNAVIVQPDGKTVVVGSSNGSSALARYNTDGSLDSSFGSGGRVLADADGSAQAVALQADGKIVVAGTAGSHFAVWRFTTTGALDTSFDGDGKATADFGNDLAHGYEIFSHARAVAIQADGKIVLAGETEDQFQYDYIAVARFTATGALDTSFDGDGKFKGDYISGADIATGVAVQSSGKIVVAVDIYSNPGLLVRLTTNGALDTSFGTNGTTATEIVSVTGVAMQSDGKIVVTGGGSNDFAMARFTANGALDTSFGTNGKTSVASTSSTSGMAIQADGKIVVAGATGQVMRFTANGALDPAFGVTGKATVDFGVHGVTIQPTDGKIVVTGSSGANFAVARFLLVGVNVTGTDGNDNIAIDPGTQAGMFKITFNGTAFDNLAGPVYIDGGNGSDVYSVSFGNWVGPVTITDRGTSGGDTLFVYGTTDGDDFSVSSFVAWKPSGAAGDYQARVDFSGVEQAILDAGAGDDIIHDPDSTNLTLLGGPGNDTIFITSTTGPVVADGGDGANTYVITMGNLAGPVTVNNTTGTSTLTVIAPPGSNTLTLTATQLTGAGQTINLNLGATAAGITVDGIAGNNQLVLQGPPPGPVTPLNVSNLSPVVGLITAPIDPFRAGSAISASADFTDANATNTHTAVWNWGDGTSSAGTVSESGGSGTVTGSHTYAAAGVYTVKLTVTANTGGMGQAVYQYVVAYDPSAGFVTGGGWINSPAGAFAANPALAGKATFGFESRYQNGNSIPTGNTQFQFQVANFNFKSTAYEWLVVSGAKARFRGTGTVNGAGGYGFELTAWDGQVSGGGGVDKFRIKFWNQNQGNGVVYDNQMGAPDGADPATALGGGSIVIHKQDPLLAANGPAFGTTAVHLTAAQVKPIVAAAIDRWATAGLDAAHLSVMHHATFSIENLGGAYLGLADPVTHGIRIDDDAAGYGWFVDPTPGDDAEFRTPGDKRMIGRMDLLSVVTHELGHLVGLDDDRDAGHAAAVMGDTLAAGTRRVPTAADMPPVVESAVSGPGRQVISVGITAARRRSTHRR
jgi:uncharacterized delta-60 repeat protein